MWLSYLPCQISSRYEHRKSIFLGHVVRDFAAAITSFCSWSSHWGLVTNYRMWRQRLISKTHMANFMQCSSLKTTRSQTFINDQGGLWQICGTRRDMTGSRCVVQGCSNRSDHSAGISMHRSPVNRTDREKWVRFVRLHRANFKPPGIFVICSEHFQEQCFERTLHVKGFRRRLLPESIPTVWEKRPKKPSSSRTRRKVSASTFVALFTFYMRFQRPRS